MPTITTMPTTVGINPNMLAVAELHPEVSSAAMMLWMTLMATAPSRPAISAFMMVLVNVL